MKIAILGYVGSGKTYISNYISDKEKVPVLHLDAVKFDKKWKPIDDSLVLPIVAEFMSKDDWIIDGYYKTLLFEERLEKADMIILMLLPRLLCFARAFKRRKARKLEGYKNDFNLWFVKFALFGCRSKKRRRAYAEIVERYKDKTVILKTRKQVANFMETIK